LLFDTQAQRRRHDTSRGDAWSGPRRHNRLRNRRLFQRFGGRRLGNWWRLEHALGDRRRTDGLDSKRQLGNGLFDAGDFDRLGLRFRLRLEDWFGYRCRRWHLGLYRSLLWFRL